MSQFDQIGQVFWGASPAISYGSPPPRTRENTSFPFVDSNLNVGLSELHENVPTLI